MNIILPLGVSFYTFEAISYIVDVYRRQIQPANRYWDYVLFVIYFPHLIAGPIMRARDFLPQIISARTLSWDQFFEGSHLFFWGIFEKVFIADNLARIVNPVFATSGPYDGGKVLVALYAFAFQIFCDFDGYSNMARGLGKLMGFDITINFRLPYFSQNPREFWHRWHITLSSWLRDYVYIPLGGNRFGEKRMYLSLFAAMFLGGLWHGASWTFVVWGVYHGSLLIIHRWTEKMRGKAFPVDPVTGNHNNGRVFFRIVKIIVFFHLVVLGWLFFRATSLAQVGEMLTSLVMCFQTSDFALLFRKFVLIIAPLLLVQCGQYCSGNLMWLFQMPRVIKIACYAFITYLIFGFGVLKPEEFIYFQF